MENFPKGSRVEKCSFEENACKRLKSADLQSEAINTEGFNFENNIFLGTKPFALYFCIPKVQF